MGESGLRVQRDGDVLRITFDKPDRLNALTAEMIEAASDAVEAAASQSWWQYVAGGGCVIGIDRFGASGKAADLFKHYGITTAHVTRALESLLAS